ncbi:MAG: RluA family pseudouridine synthase [Nitrospirae bacterium]|nr:RluA family pseudouridine synthase [Nitrospirota bacterium]MDA1304735.1 RluA family pseudouridine synthase [Nitrospirota bacterium]
MPHVETRTELIVTAGESPKRLDHFLANRDPDFSRTILQRLILNGHITVQGQTVKPSHKIKPGDQIVLIVPRPEPLDMEPEPIPLEILYEDDSLLVLNKQANLVVHPAPGNWSGTLVNALLYHLKTETGSLSNIGGKERPGLVHRLDKNTTGVMVIAKHDQAHANLAAQFKRHSIARVYEALILGVPKRHEGTIDLAIGRDTIERKKFSARTTKPKASATVYRVTERFGTIASTVDLFPQTGRTHQLRVHLSSIDCPILGDPTYGGKRVSSLEDIPIPRVMLHAKVLGFVHPMTQEEMSFSAPMPADMEETIQQIRTHMDSKTKQKKEGEKP